MEFPRKVAEMEKICPVCEKYTNLSTEMCPLKEQPFIHGWELQIFLEAQRVKARLHPYIVDHVARRREEKKHGEECPHPDCREWYGLNNRIHPDCGEWYFTEGRIESGHKTDLMCNNYITKHNGSFTAHLYCTNNREKFLNCEEHACDKGNRDCDYKYCDCNP